MKRKNKHLIKLCCYIIVIVAIQTFYLLNSKENIKNNNTINTDTNETKYTLEDIPPYTGQAWVTLNNNVPYFEESDFTNEVFEKYSKLDDEGRCGRAFANICIDTMPKEGEKRESISHIKNLSGWVQKEYPSIIGTRYLYNRCHLIGWQLSNENDNIQNLMTGTAYLNYAMLEYENKVADYIKENKENNYHVLYRVTPIFENNNKLANRCSNRSTDL